jgi:excisionase family DNA binding protein
MPSPTIQPDTLFTSHDVGRLLQINPSSVVKWVNSGLLTAYRTPGRHRRIRAADLLAFLHEHGMFVPHDLRVLGPRRVFFIDDDATLLASMGRAMKAHKDRVELITFSNGIDALLRLGSEMPEVVVIDVQMPGMDGGEVIAKIKGNPATEKIEVYAVTGNVKPELEKKLKSLGARGVLVKPITASQLIDVVAPGAQQVKIAQ